MSDELNSQIIGDLVQGAVEAVKPSTTLKKIRPVRIKLKSTGQFIAFSNGKTLWKRMGDAKSAFRLHIEWAIGRQFTIDWSAGGKYRHTKSGKLFESREKEAYKEAAYNAALQEFEFVEVDS